MLVPWFPVIWFEVLGSVVTVILAIWCVILSWNWNAEKRDDTFRHYIFLLTGAIVLFALSRSFGHLIKQVLFFWGEEQTWMRIAPYSGAVNTATFIIIFSFGIYFSRQKGIHEQLEQYKNNLEKLVTIRTEELARANAALQVEILERKKSEEALKKEENKFRTVADYTYAWEYWISPSGNMRYVSPSCERISGYGRDEFMQTPLLISSIVHPDDNQLFRRHLEEELYDEKVCQMEFRIINKKGEVCWIIHTCQPVYDYEGKYIGRRASNHDITARKLIWEEKERLIIERQKALDKVKVLSGFLPICASCKKIRDDKGYWKQIELYISDHSEAEFSHGICPECAEKMYPEIFEKEQKK